MDKHILEDDAIDITYTLQENNIVHVSVWVSEKQNNIGLLNVPIFKE